MLSICKPASLLLLGSLCAPVASWGNETAIEGCKDYVMQICGPDTPPGMTLLDAFEVEGAIRVSLRDGAGEIWQCSGFADGSVGDVAMSEFPQPRRIQLAANAPSLVLKDDIASSGTAQYVVTLNAGQQLFAHVIGAPPGLILEVRGPDGAPLPLREVTDRTFLDSAPVAGDYAIRLINHGTDSAALLSIIAAY